MQLSLSPEQEALAATLDALLARSSGPERVREVEEAGGFDAPSWQALVDVGVLDMALPDGGATLVDLAVVADRCGAHLAAVPLVEAQVAARLLARVGAHHWLDRIADGACVVFGPGPGTRAGVAGGTGTGAVAVAGAAAADAVVVWRDDTLVVVEGDGVGPTTATLGRRADAAVHAGAGTVIATGPAARRAAELALDEWRILTAAALAGLAGQALVIGVDYAQDRHQFGVPIGSFQALQHRFADLHTAVAGARLLALEAAWAWDRADARSPELAAMAFAWAGAQAEAAAAFSLHVHGGYGFMVEYAIHLYVRRAKALRVALGDPVAGDQLVADRRWGPTGSGPAPRPDPVEVESHLDFALGAATVELQDELRRFVGQHLSAEAVEAAHRTGTIHDWAFHRALAARGYLSAGWPEEVGGQGRDPIETTALQQVLYELGAPVDGMAIAAMVAATLVLRGNDWHKAEVLPDLLRGDALVCLGYSEPDAGSDVAAVATRAVADGDEWVVDGQKMFTTMAHEARYVFLLARTSTEASRHRGLTMFLVPLDAPGVTITPVRTLGGERTNITWYDGVRIPDRCRVGEVGDGWSVMHAALVYERNSANWGEPHRLVESVAAWAVETGRFDDPTVRARLGALATADEVGRLLLYRTAWLAGAGGLPLVEGSMAKLFISEWFSEAASVAVDVLGPAGTLAEGAVGAPLAGLVEHAYRHSTVTTIYGGSSEVQRGIIAERGLGLPRSR